MIRSVLRAALVPMVALWATASAAESFVIVGATVVDGTGGPAHKADVRIKDGRIAAVGKRARSKGVPIIDGSGLVLAPTPASTLTQTRSRQRRRASRRSSPGRMAAGLCPSRACSRSAKRGPSP